MNDSRDDGPTGSPADPGGADAPRGTGNDIFRGADARPLPPAVPAVATPPRRHRLRRFFGWWMVLGLIATACLVLALGLSVFDTTPVSIVIDGDDVSGITMGGAGFAMKALVVACLAAVALLMVLIVPLIVLIVVAAVVLAVVAGFGTPILILAFALAVLTSPIWLVGLVVWFFARRRRAHSATMAA